MLPAAVIVAAGVSLAPGALTNLSTRLVILGDGLQAAGVDVRGIEDYSAGFRVLAKPGDPAVGLPLLVSRRLDQDSPGLVTAAMTLGVRALSVVGVSFDQESFICAR